MFRITATKVHWKYILNVSKPVLFTFTRVPYLSQIYIVNSENIVLWYINVGKLFQRNGSQGLFTHRSLFSRGLVLRKHAVRRSKSYSWTCRGARKGCVHEACTGVSSEVIYAWALIVNN